MSTECNNKHFGNMLHAYELGLLTPEDNQSFELHLYECDYCFERVREFTGETSVIRHDSDLQQVVADTTADTIEEPQAKPSESRRRLPGLVPAFLVTVIVLALLILKPWQIEIHPGTEAIAGENRLAIMYFDNLSDPEDSQRLGEITANLLITALSESRYLQVVSSQRLYDIMKSRGYEGARMPNRDVATDVARKADAKWMLIGKILQVQPYLVVSTELVDVLTGNALASTRISGAPGEDVFSLVDRLAMEVKGDLTLPAGAQQEPTLAVASVTTNSPDAYRYYLEGIELDNKYFVTEAKASYHKALEFDSTFAMAYYHLALHGDSKLIDKALEYSLNLTYKEKLYIMSAKAQFSGNDSLAIEELEKIVARYPDEKYALFRIGNFRHYQGKYDEALEYFNKAVKVDPLYKQALNLMIYAHARSGNLEEAIKAADRYIEVAPTEPNPYDSKGDAYAFHGKLPEAIESYRMALSKRPDYAASAEKLGVMYLFEHEYAKAESLFAGLDSMRKTPESPLSMYYLSIIPSHQGKLKRAVAVCDSLIAAGAGGTKYSMAVLLVRRGIIRMEMGDYDQALADMKQGAEVFKDHTPPVASFNDLGFYAHCSALSGKFDQAEAAIDSLRANMGKSGYDKNEYIYACGTVAFVKKDYKNAIGYFQKGADLWEENVANYLLALAYLDAGMPDKAIDRFKENLLRCGLGWRVTVGFWNVKMHYYLGQAYEQKGLTANAIDEYQTFLDIWKDADPGIAVVDSAKTRLNRLKTRP